MKQFLAFVLLALLSACGGAGNDRPEDKTDNSSGAPYTVQPSHTNPMDTSTNQVQDSSTTMGYDTSANRKN